MNSHFDARTPKVGLAGTGGMRIAWVVPQKDAAIASTRYRCYYPAMALERFGVESKFFSQALDVLPEISSFEAIVFVKSLDGMGLGLAQQGKALGAKIFVDLCDNIVVSNYSKTPSNSMACNLAAVSVIADAFIVPSAALADAIRPVVAARTRFIVIPDQIETAESVAAATLLDLKHREPAQKIKLRRWRRRAATAVRQPLFTLRALSKKLIGYRHVLRSRAGRIVRHVINSQHQRAATLASRAPHPPCGLGHRKTVLWFGNYGSPHSEFGLLTLLKIVPALERVNRDVPLELVVISNNYQQFTDAIQPIDVPTRYIQWSPNAVFDALETASLCVLPFGGDPFSTTKSANRAVLALHKGVPVVTTRLRSMDQLQGIVEFDDWETGLRRFLGPEGDAHREEALIKWRREAQAAYAPEAIGQTWLQLLAERAPKQCIGYTRQWRREVGVLLNLPQDLDLLLPVIDEIERRPDVFLRVLVAPGLFPSSNRILRSLVERQIVPFLLDRGAVLQGEDRILRNFDALLTASETSLGAHKLAHALTKSAKNLGIATYTMQHGLENVGLTYCDNRHGPNVQFAAEHVLLWGNSNQLPDWVLPETRRKCITVGRTSRPTYANCKLPPEFAERDVIGVFENLHWHRYSASYTSQFIECVLALARARPSLVILAKPHPAGRFLIKRKDLLTSAPENLVVADTGDERWEPYSASALIPLCRAVVTTPSTVALDAAEIDVPVAVARLGMDLPVFSGLPMFDDPAGLIAFVDQALANGDAARAGLAAYRDSVRMPGDAAKRIVDLLLETSTKDERRRRQLSA